ncbi:MAG: hypothetical protein AAFV93_23455 [Chloroflexota bacterium]
MARTRCPVTAIGMQLREDALLIPCSSGLTTQKRVWGSRVRFWRLTAESLLETNSNIKCFFAVHFSSRN